MKVKGYLWGIALVAVVFGFMLAMQLKADTVEDPSLESTNRLAEQIEQRQKDVQELQEKVDNMRLALEEAANQPELRTIQRQLSTASIMAGVTPVTGPGIEVVLNDSNVVLQPGQNPNLYVLHDEDVLKVLNELKAAGAEALALNDQRMIATSEIRCTGPTILTNGNKRLAAPFVITAIGDPDTLYNALFMKGGVAEQLKFWGIQVSAKKMKEVVIPSYGGAISYDLNVGGERS
ncbi:DUF881 domain-containing protein [Desulfofalx alkaliphila]|uniref:DUF881 domain-containing protein n=1 Tax=Desulfofalx alkaliphila TaxID=105483 RepID=UPI0004E16F73|nr:DUF881 domain-containing protein [Desulfofalx alkaliphila]